MLTRSDESGRIGFHREEPDLLSVNSYNSGSSAGPNPTKTVFPDLKNIVVSNSRKFSAGVVCEFLPVKTVQSGFGAHPKVTAAVLHHTGHLHLGQAVAQGVLPVGGQGEVGLGKGIQGKEQAQGKAEVEIKVEVEGERKRNIRSLTGK